MKKIVGLFLFLSKWFVYIWILRFLAGFIYPHDTGDWTIHMPDSHVLIMIVLSAVLPNPLLKKRREQMKSFFLKIRPKDDVEIPGDYFLRERLSTAQPKQSLTTPVPQKQSPRPTVSDIDGMDGHAFEYWCADLLRKLGYRNVMVTPDSGDQGVDIVAEKGGVSFAIQCKCYSSNIGNTPIQEVTAGKSFYHCQVGVVMSNRYFTAGARQLAEVNGILLWDRDKIKEMLEKTKTSPD